MNLFLLKIYKGQKMKNWILNFIADERGTAAMEYGMAAVIMGGGAASGLSLLKDALQAKQDNMISILEDQDAN